MSETDSDKYFDDIQPQGSSHCTILAASLRRLAKETAKFHSSDMCYWMDIYYLDAESNVSSFPGKIRCPSTPREQMHGVFDLLHRSQLFQCDNRCAFIDRPSPDALDTADPTTPTDRGFSAARVRHLRHGCVHRPRRIDGCAQHHSSHNSSLGGSGTSYCSHRCEHRKPASE